jgi:hypothetical protein
MGELGDGDAEEDRREDRPAAEPATEAQPVAERLRDQQDQEDLGRVGRGDGRDGGLAGEEDVLRARAEPVGNLRDQADRETAADEQNEEATLRGPSLARSPAARFTAATISAVTIPTTTATIRS